MKFNLTESVSSPQDLKAVITEIRAYNQWFSQNTIKMQVAGSTPPTPTPVSEAASSLIKGLAAAEPLSTKSLDGLIKDLEKLEASSPRITITLAAVPSGGLKKLLIGWCRQNISPDILVDFRFNATILGGMVVRFGSHIYDLSFRRKILAARSRFPEVLRRV